jgi:L-amino acid N-acyltransferase YncA
MVAFSGSDPIGVLIGAKRTSGTLVQRIAVHPDHRRQGHGRHLLASLGSKLAILGPPRIVAEIPATFADACELFSDSEYVQEALLTDYLLQPGGSDSPDGSSVFDPPAPGLRRSSAEAPGAEADDHDGRFVIPVSVDDLAANGLLGETELPVCWNRSVETLTARKEELAGFAVASDERIEACLLYVKPEAIPEGSPQAAATPAEIVSLRTFVEDDGARVKQLLSRLRAQGIRSFRIPKVHPAEISKDLLQTLGFRPTGEHRLYAARARSG